LLLKTLLTQAQEDPEDRCKCRALTGLSMMLIGLDEDDDAPNVVPHLDAIVNQALIPILAKGTVQVQEAGLALAATIAQLVEDDFAPYYPSFMTAAKQILNQSGVHGKRILCETAIELAGHLAVAAGPEQFSQDAPVLMEALYSLHTANDPNRTHNFGPSVLLAFGNIAESLGEAFEPYLPAIMPSIMAAAKMQPKMLIGEADEDTSGGDGGGRLGVEVTESQGRTQLRIPGEGGVFQTVSFSTTEVEEKQTALALIKTIAEAMETKVSGVAKELAQTVAGDLESEFSQVRAAAYECVPAFLSTLLDEPSSFLTLWPALTGAATIKAIVNLPLQQVSEYVCKSVNGCMGQLHRLQRRVRRTTGVNGGGVLDAPELRAFVEQLYGALAQLMQRVLARLRSSEGGSSKKASHGTGSDEWEDVDEDEEEEPERDIINTVMQISGATFKVFGPSVAPLFHAHLQPVYSPFLTSPILPADPHNETNSLAQVAAICIFADAIDLGGPDTQQYAADFMGVVMGTVVCDAITDAQRAADDEPYDEDVLRVQASAFAIGVLGNRAPQVLQPRLPEAIQKLEAILAHPHSKTPERRLAADCACCALIKLYVAFTQQLTVDTVRPAMARLVAEWLPLTDDDDDARIAHGAVLSMVERAVDGSGGEGSGIIDVTTDAHTRKEVCRLLEYLSDKDHSSLLAAKDDLPEAMARVRGIANKLTTM